VKNLLPAVLGALVALSGCLYDPIDSVPEPGTARAAVADPADVDVADRLAAIPGMTVEEIAAPWPGYRHFALTYAQPVDHSHPEVATFPQRILLIHRDEAQPTVINTAGYGASNARARYGLLPYMLDGNYVVVEHRFFGASVPDPADVRYLTIDQSAADHHAIIQALQTIYTGAWVSTGASKGGMTASYHHRRYPDDVAGTVSDVAPLSFGHKDLRYVGFLKNVGDAGCRAKLDAFQRQALSRRATLAPMIDEYMASIDDGLHALPGGAEQALDIAIAEFLFQFWQYGEPSWCDEIPGADATDQQVFDFIDRVGTFFVGDDLTLQYYGPYYYQAVTQLGYPRLPTANIRDLLHYDPNDYRPYVAAYGDHLPFDPLAMLDMALWSILHSDRMIYVYGQFDPWSAAAYPIWPGRGDVHRFVVPQGNHGSNIGQLTGDDQTEALETLERWTGVTPRLPPPPSAAAAFAPSAPWFDSEDDAERRAPL